MALTSEQKQAIRIITASNANVDYATAISSSDQYALSEIARLGPWFLEQATKAEANKALWQSVLTGE